MVLTHSCCYCCWMFLCVCVLCLLLSKPECFLIQDTAEPEEYGVPSNTLDPSISWKDIHWLRSLTRLPIIIKGILTKEDAELAVEHGVQGIIVSNHGGRQLDGGPATVRNSIGFSGFIQFPPRVLEPVFAGGVSGL